MVLCKTCEAITGDLKCVVFLFLCVVNLRDDVVFLFLCVVNLRDDVMSTSLCNPFGLGDLCYQM